MRILTTPQMQPDWALSKSHRSLSSLQWHRAFIADTRISSENTATALRLIVWRYGKPAEMITHLNNSCCQPRQNCCHGSRCPSYWAEIMAGCHGCRALYEETDTSTCVGWETRCRVVNNIGGQSLIAYRDNRFCGLTRPKIIFPTLSFRNISPVCWSIYRHFAGVKKYPLDWRQYALTIFQEWLCGVYRRADCNEGTQQMWKLYTLRCMETCFVFQTQEQS